MDTSEPVCTGCKAPQGCLLPAPWPPVPGQGGADLQPGQGGDDLHSRATGLYGWQVVQQTVADNAKDGGVVTWDTMQTSGFLAALWAPRPPLHPCLKSRDQQQGQPFTRPESQRLPSTCGVPAAAPSPTQGPSGAPLEWDPTTVPAPAPLPSTPTRPIPSILHVSTLHPLASQTQPSPQRTVYIPSQDRVQFSEHPGNAPEPSAERRKLKSQSTALQQLRNGASLPGVCAYVV